MAAALIVALAASQEAFRYLQEEELEPEASLGPIYDAENDNEE